MDRTHDHQPVSLPTVDQLPPMQEIRRDPILGRWVIIASERSKRPTDFQVNRDHPSGGVCPFCHGSESHTPREVLSFRDPGQAPDTPGWRVRVVPNKYPALKIEGDMGRRGVGMYDKMNAIGAHEVVIDTPNHDAQLGDLEAWQVAEVLRAYRERIVELKKDRRFRYILVFKNQGPDAGATLEHTHTQIIATPVVPKRVTEEIDGARKHFEQRERCVFCDIRRQELETQARVVIANDQFVTLAPFASRFPYETWILPRTHAPRYEDVDDAGLEVLGAMLKSVLARLNTALDRPPYNFVLHTSPSGDETANEYYHWHLEIMPKLTQMAGFEWGSGFYINPVPPEAAAQILREASE